MNMTISITNLSHEDIVNILASANYGSQMVAIRYNREEWEALPEEQKDKSTGACQEDICADLLLAGKAIQLVDLMSEGEDNSHRQDGEVFEVEFEQFGGHFTDYEVVYDRTLKDFLEVGKTEEGAALYMEFANEEDDLYTSENLLQLVMFGEVVYG